MIAASADLLRELPLSAACAVLGLGRGSYYRRLGGQASKEALSESGQDEEAGLLAALEQVVLEFPGYGYLRVDAPAPPRGLPGQSQACLPADGRSRLVASKETRPGADDGQRAWVCDLPEPAGGLRLADADWPQSGVGCGSDVCALGRQFLLPGRAAGSLLAPDRRLGSVGKPGGGRGPGRPGDGVGKPATERWMGTSLGPRRAIRVSSLRPTTEAGGGPDQHGGSGSPAGKRTDRALDANGEGRGGRVPPGRWRSIGLSERPSKGLVVLSKRYTTGSGCTRRWDTGRRANSRRSSPPAFFNRCVSQAQGLDTPA